MWGAPSALLAAVLGNGMGSLTHLLALPCRWLVPLRNLPTVLLMLQAINGNSKMTWAWPVKRIQAEFFF
eukprot:1149617-Pelagomonas_calceolata.AAC.2